MKIEEVKKNLGRKVRYKPTGGSYILTGCTLRLDLKRGSFFYQAELTDTAAQNSIMITRLEEVENETD